MDRWQAYVAAWITALACVAGIPCARADQLTLSGGQVVTGVIEGQTADRYLVRTPHGLISFSASSVRSVQRDSDRDNRLSALSDALSRGEIARALGQIDPAVTATRELAMTDELLLKQADKIVAQAAGLPVPDCARLVSYIRNRAVSPSPELRLLAARLLLARGQTDEGLEELGRIPDTFFREGGPGRSAAVAALSAEVRRAIDSDSPETGLRLLGMLGRVAPDAVGTGSATLVHLADADRKRSAGEFEAALDASGGLLRRLAPGIAFNHAVETLRRAEKQTSASAMAALYERFCTVFEGAGFTDERGIVIRRHAELLAALGRYDEAATAALRLSLIDADAGALLEHRVEYLRRRSEVSGTDTLGRYRVAAWAQKMGLRAEAYEEYQSLVRDPAVGENARLQIMVMNAETEKREFGKVSELYEAKRFRESIQAAEQFRRRFPGSELARQAAVLAELAGLEMHRRKTVRSAEAEALRQHAERLFYQERLPEAVEAINRLEVDFADTPAAADAAMLRARIDRVLARSSRISTGPAIQAGGSRSRAVQELSGLASQIRGESRTNTPPKR